MKPQMNTDEHRLNLVTEAVIGSAYRVANTLGCGFLERVYENALSLEMKSAGLSVKQQSPVRVHYRDQIVGEYIADLLVEECVLVELKAVKALDEVHMAQCMNYLRATGLKICLLINFGRPKVQIRHIIN